MEWLALKITQHASFLEFIFRKMANSDDDGDEFVPTEEVDEEFEENVLH